MIEIELEKFETEGYLILRNVVPVGIMDGLRESAEKVLHKRWPDGIEEDNFQPMIHGLERYVDEETADLIEFCYNEEILEANRKLFRAEQIAPAAIFMMNNPVADHGPWWWHRDVSPLGSKGPLEGLQMDNIANGPVILHWNVALYDDDVYWVVPGSHLRPNTEAENEQLSAVPHTYANGQRPQGEKRHEPLPGSVCADLKAGDAVINYLELFHWGSNYSPKLRRTYHIGYRSFGARFYYEGYRRDLEFARFMSPRVQEMLQQFQHLYDEECDAVERAFRGIIDRDEGSFRAALVQLHPAEKARFVCVVHLCRIAQEMETGGWPEYADRFDKGEKKTLWDRFRALDQALMADEEQWFPGFQIKGPSRYRLNEMPPAFDTDKFVASW